MGCWGTNTHMLLGQDGRSTTGSIQGSEMKLCSMYLPLRHQSQAQGQVERINQDISDIWLQKWENSVLSGISDTDVSSTPIWGEKKLA